MKVLVLEQIQSESAPPVKNFDHVFSFRARAADSFPYDLIEENEAALLYDEVYQSLLERLRLHSVPGSPFVYRGVNLLWCFKKALFNYAYHVRVHYEVMKRLVRKFGSADFYLDSREGAPEYPSLAYILKASPLSDSAQIHRIESNSIPDIILPPRSRSLLQSMYQFLPEKLGFGNLAGAEIGFFSDYQKSRNVLGHLRNSLSVYYADIPSPRLFWNAFKTKSAVYQAVYNPQNQRLSAMHSDLMPKELGQTGIFKGFSLVDSPAGSELLMEKYLAGLFEEKARKLFFQIDTMHDFFSKAKSLKSVLLDEDISASKNAFCQIARQYGVSSYVECHGVLGHASGYIPVTADYIFAWGKAQKEKLTAWGCPENQILVSGSSRYDDYSQKDKVEAKRKVADDLGLDSSKKILLLTFPLIRKDRPLLFESRWVKIFQETLHSLSKFYPEISLVIKFKARSQDQNKEYGEQWLAAKNFRHRFTLLEDYDSLLLARASDLVVAYGTTFAVDARAMGTPVIYMYHATMPLLGEFKGLPGFYWANSSEELEGFIRKLLLEKHAAETSLTELRKQCLANDDGVPAGQWIAERLKFKNRDLRQPPHSRENQNTIR